MGAAPPPLSQRSVGSTERRTPGPPPLKEIAMFLVPLTRNVLTPRDARAFERLFDDTLDRFFGGPAVASGSIPARSEAARTPALDVSESERSYSVRLEMPGVKKEDIQVTIDGRRVTVQAGSESVNDKKDGDAAADRAVDRIVYSERTSTRYARSFTLPLEVDQAGASAKLEHGVLQLELPKRGVVGAAQLTIN
jgi:HSP20 family protein